MSKPFVTQPLPDPVITPEDVVLLPKIGSSRGLKEKFTRQEFRNWGMFTKNNEISLAKVGPSDVVGTK